MTPLWHLRRHVVLKPWLYWLAAAGVAVCAGWIVHGQTSGLDEARDAWGESRAVLVTSRDHRAGDLIDAATIELPLAAIPATALGDLEPASEARHDLAEGEILVETDVAGTAGPAALAPAGTLTIGVREYTSSSIAAVGAPVQVFAEGVRLADAATVVAVTDDVIFVAVPEDDAGAVAAAAHGDLATLAYEP